MGAALVIVLAGQLGCSTFTNRMLLHPSSHFVPTDAAREEFPARSGEFAGIQLETFYAEYGAGDSEPELFVLALTGNAGRAESMQNISEALFETWLGTDDAPARIGVLSLQYPGFGTSPRGSASLESLVDASADALGFLNERAGSRPIFIHALSMGTVAALSVARTMGPLKVQGLVLAKPPNLGPLLIDEHGWWNAWLIALPMALQLPDCARSAENAAAITGLPALFLIAEADEFVPAGNSMQVHNAFAGPKRLINLPGGHNSTVWSRTTPELDDGFRWLWRETGLGREPGLRAATGVLESSSD